MMSFSFCSNLVYNGYLRGDTYYTSNTLYFEVIMDEKISNKLSKGVGSMKYIVFTDEDLFNRWRALEAQFGVRLLAGLLQNDMFIPTEELNKEFEELHDILTELHETYTPSALQPIVDLRNETQQYIIRINSQKRDPEHLHSQLNYGCPARRSKLTGEKVSFNPEYSYKDCNCAHPENLGKLCEPTNCPIIRELSITQASLSGSVNA